MAISEKAFSEAAKALRCDVAAIKAVAEVEGAGSGFLPSGRPKILFEGHKFHQHTQGQYDRTHPTLSYPKWTRKHYIGGEGEWTRFNEAAALNREAAIQATSFGMFQILGENWETCGCLSVEHFWRMSCSTEDAQLALFVQFVIKAGLADELRRHDWAGFARRYNGPAYAENQYDKRLAAAYQKHGGRVA